jgi:hypothetical protein
MLTTMAIPVTIGIMVSLTLLFGIAGIISWNTLAKQKQIYQRKETLWKSYKMISSSILRKNTFSFIVLSLIAVGIGLITSPINSLAVWLLVVVIIILYIGITYLTPILSMGTMWFNGRQKIRKWNIILGQKEIEINTPFKKSFSSDTKSMKLGIILSSAFLYQIMFAMIRVIITIYILLCHERDLYWKIDCSWLKNMLKVWSEVMYWLPWRAYLLTTSYNCSLSTLIIISTGNISGGYIGFTCPRPRP